MSSIVVIMLLHHLRSAKNREVEFGRLGSSNYKKYVFKPKYPDKDRMSPDNPHICEVSDKEHISRFLSITEGYQLYLGDDESANNQQKDADENDNAGSKFDDLANLDVAAMNDDDLRKFAIEVMGITPKNKAPILQWYNEMFDKSLDPASNIADLLRQCAAAIVEKEQMMAGAEI